ncbi:hypothetical protein ACHQM5_003553 [Ranunculus cassubicifolius]
MGNLLVAKLVTLWERQAESLEVPLLKPNEIRVVSGEDGNKSSEYVTFKIAVTKDEQRKILNHKKDLRYSSVEELLEDMKVISRKITDVRTKGGETSQKWKLALETISDSDGH